MQHKPVWGTGRPRWASHVATSARSPWLLWLHCSPVWGTVRPSSAVQPPPAAIGARSQSRSPWLLWLHHTLLTCVRDCEAQVSCPTSTCSHWCKVTVKITLVTMVTSYTAHLCEGLWGPGQLSNLHLQPLVQGYSQCHQEQHFVRDRQEDVGGCEGEEDGRQTGGHEAATHQGLH